jgi:(4-(4-[2-(gamma-L-glutamylamino)ethyl]phenoxymethyl)furan-2-yl)methanamine synthase
MTWLGLDIGGANLKGADGRGWAHSAAFALWRHPRALTGALGALIDRAPAFDRLAVTMTGELCDCFHNISDGVRQILTAVREVAGPRDVRVYLVDGSLATIDEALTFVNLAAASNWHALARFACRFVADNVGLLIDVGSTTTDIIPLVGGEVAAHGRTDTQRLVSRELVYSGVGRTPICAVVRSLPLCGQDCPIAAELFATTADVYLLLNEICENPTATWTADGKALTVALARQRIARMLCADAAELTSNDFDTIVRYVRDAQLTDLKSALTAVVQRLPGRLATVIISGSGEFLARSIAVRLSPPAIVVSLNQELGSEVSQCAPAHALAVLAAEWEGRV